MKSMNKYIKECTDLNFFAVIRDWVTFASDICILLITLYTFYKTFISKKIRFVSVFESLSISDGNNFSIVIENKSLSPQVINDIHLIIDNKYKIQVKKLEAPLILEPYTAQKVESERYSYTDPRLPGLIGTKMVLEVTTSRKKLYLPIHKKIPKVKPELKKLSDNVMKITNIYNNKIVPSNAIFVLIVIKGECENTIFIFENGTMTGTVLGYNAVPEEVAKDIQTLRNFLDSWLKPSEVKYYVEQFHPYF